MMQKILAIAAMTSVLTTCGISASADQEVIKPVVEMAEEAVDKTFIEFLIDFDKY